MSMNYIAVMGRITKDIELRHTNSGTPVASFTVAVDRDFDKGKTDFIDCVAWRDKAEFAAKYFRKGSKAVVTGSLQMRDWQDKDGNKRKVAEIVVSSIYFADSKKDSENRDFPAASSNTNSGFTEVEDDGDLPF